MVKNKFLCLLKSALEGVTTCNLYLTKEETEEILSLAQLHKLLPLVYDCIYTQGYSENTNDFPHLRQTVRLTVSQQALRTESFTALYTTLNEANLSPIVVKGIVCRNLYPKPDLRISADEDLLISPEDYGKYRKTLISLGFSPHREEKESYQTSFIRGDGFHIELHTSLFNPNTPLFSKWNDIFADAFSRVITIETGNTKILTLSHTDHFLYLVLHALKHFIHSGVGIRQVCDIVMFAKKHTDSIDWEYVFTQCENLGALKFTLGVLSIGRNHLVPKESADKIPLPSLVADETALLNDILSAGIYGGSSLSRKHSGSITFDAAQHGKKQSLLKRAFPPAKTLGHRYSYAKRSPVLLPVAWGHRLLRYGKEVKISENNSPSEAVKTGNNRIELLREYGLVSD